MTLPIWYVHGAGASPRSFRWLSEQMPVHEAHMFQYATSEGLDACTNRLAGAINQQGRCIVVGHSLGGLIAAGLAHEPNVQGIATLCAPFGGLTGATWLALLRTDMLFRDLTPMNPALRQIRNGLLSSRVPHLPIVATSGLPFMQQANDGAITVETQMAIGGVLYHQIPVNHFEVLLADETAALVGQFVTGLDTVRRAA